MAVDYDRGRYKVRVIGQEFIEAKTGTPGFSLKIQPISYYGTTNEVPCDDGDPAFITWWMSENSVEYMVRDLKGLGWNAVSFEDLKPGAYNFHDFSGLEFDAVHFTDKQGYPKWALSSSPAPLDDAGLSKLDKMFAKHLSKPKSNGAKSNAKAKSAETQPVGSAEKEEIPF